MDHVVNHEIEEVMILRLKGKKYWSKQTEQFPVTSVNPDVTEKLQTLHHLKSVYLQHIIFAVTDLTLCISKRTGFLWEKSHHPQEVTVEHHRAERACDFLCVTDLLFGTVVSFRKDHVNGGTAHLNILKTSPKFNKKGHFGELGSRDGGRHTKETDLHVTAVGTVTHTNALQSHMSNILNVYNIIFWRKFKMCVNEISKLMTENQYLNSNISDRQLYYYCAFIRKWDQAQFRLQLKRALRTGWMTVKPPHAEVF